jgi:hypothetical protein
MIAVSSLLIVLLISLIVVRIASVALTLSGMSREAARFQARSAWTGTGFTTEEAEAVLRHPVRRRIISLLMQLRGVGLVTAASTLMLSFVNVNGPSQGIERFLLLGVGLLSIWLLARSRWIDMMVSRAIAWALKRYGNLDTRDYAGLLHLAGEYAIMEMKVQEEGWLAGKRLDELRLAEEGILVLGITRPDGSYVGAPRGDAVIEAAEMLILYGQSPALADLGSRRKGRSGERAHEKATAERKIVEKAEAQGAEAD